jgi:hypothetical protein
MSTIYTFLAMTLIAMSAYGMVSMMRGYNPTLPPEHIRPIIRWVSVVMHASTILVLLRFLTLVFLPEYVW